MPTKYYNHWLLLIRSFRILLKKDVPNEELESAKLIIYDIVDSIPTLYEENRRTYNSHSLLHIIQTAENRDAPWAYSSFLTEDAGGLKKIIPGTTHAAEQIFKRFL